MKTYYKLVDDLYLTLDHIQSDPNEKIPEPNEEICPTPAMMDHFYQNCVKLGILEIIYR